MNFLPLVLIFITLFGALSFSLSKHLALDVTEADAYKGRLRAIRQAYNKREEYYRERLDVQLIKKKKQNTHLKPSSGSTKTKEEKTYFRLDRLGSPDGAINLAYLLTPNKNNALLERKAAEYLEAIYGKASFIQKLGDSNWAHHLITFFCEKQKEAFTKTGSYLPLQELIPNGALKEHYHKMIRGTNTYDASRQRGYLPLERCITFHTGDTKPIYFPFANPTLLSVFFGKPCVQTLQETEWPNGVPQASHYTNYSLSKEAFEKLLSNTSSEMVDLFDFEFRQGKKVPEQFTDPKTFITAHVRDASPLMH